VVSLVGDILQLDGVTLDAALDPREERQIPALREALAAGTDTIHVTADPDTTWRPLRRVLTTASSKGVSSFWLRVGEGPLRGPMSLPVPLPRAETAPVPVGQLRLHHQGGMTWGEGELRFSGTRPVDCATSYPEGPLRAACSIGDSPSVWSFGCLMPLPPTDAAAQWPETLGALLSDLGADGRWSWVVMTDITVEAAVLDAATAALLATGVSRVSLGGASSTTSPPAPCQPEVTDAAAVHTAQARWSGTSP
jgi:hypothetical protein